MRRQKGIKAKAWESVKRWARRNRTDCFTCPTKNLETYNAQAGHYWPAEYVGTNNTLTWSEHNIRLQCGRCNGAGQGMKVEFRRGLVEEYGEEFVTELDARAYRKDPVKDWSAIIQKFDSL